MKKRIYAIGAVLLLVAGLAYAGINDRFSAIELGDSGTWKDTIILPEISAPSGTPASNTGTIYVKDNSGTSDLYFEDDGGTVTELTAAGATAWSDIADPTADSTITFADNEITTLSFADTNEDMMNIRGVGAFGDVSVLRIDQITGNATDGTVLEVVAADANVDPLVVSASGKANALVVGQNTGVVTIAGVAENTSALVVTAGDILVSDGDVTLSSGDLSVTGAIGLSGLVTLENGLTIDNASNNILEINENSEELKVTFASNTLDLSSTSGINQIDIFDGDATTLTKAANGANDDLTLSVTGAQDSSLVLASSGTAADALTISTSAGGMDIAVVGSAAGEDLDLDSDSSINLTASEAGVADAVVISTDGAGSGIDITSLADIDITTTGAAGEDITLTNTGGSINLEATEADGAAIVVNASDAAGGIDVDAGTGGIAVDITGAADFRVDSSAGSIVLVGAEAAADAVTIDAEDAAGGIDIDAGTGGIAVDITGAADFRLDSSAGSVVLIGAEAAADAITIDAENAAGGIDMDFGTGAMTLTGTGVAANLTIDADAGSIDFTDSSNITVTSSEAAEDLTISQIGGNDSSIIVTSAGTGANAIELTTSDAAGDIDVNAGDAITVDAGDIVVTTDDAAADQFKVAAGGTIAGNAINLTTTNGGIIIDANNADNGDIDIDAADDLDIISAGNTTFAVTGTLSMGTAAVTDVLRDAETVTSANVIAATECGKTFYLSSGTEFQSTLPALSGVSAGCTMRFVIAAAAGGANYTVITGNSKETQIYGLISVNSTHVQCAAEDTITFVDGDAIGDWVELESDGTSWFITGEAFTAAKLTCTDEA
jgi:hypothetical protein